MKDLKLALVGYLNTKPFEYGLKTSEVRVQYSIYYDTPAACVEFYKNDKVEIALVPVGALPECKDYRIITNTCIGCDDEVRTVVLMSNEPVADWTSVILDSHSRSSALLAQILMKEYFHKEIAYSTEKIDELEKIEKNQAVLMIGDKVFKNENQYKYTYDLGHYWKLMTGLPFAYAVWIAKPHVVEADIKQLNADLLYGIENLDEVIKDQEAQNQGLNLEAYYKDHIDYRLDDDKLKAIALYLEKVGALSAEVDA